MTEFSDLLLLLVVLTDFWVLGTTRLSSVIRAAALQGAILAALPIALHPGLSPHILGLGRWGRSWSRRSSCPRSCTGRSARRRSGREVEPVIGFTASLCVGAVAVALSFAVAQRLPLPEAQTALLVPVALATVIVGLIVLTTRSKALTQVVGYLILENGIYVFGLSQAERVPFLVEIGVLLDVFVGVFIMGIVVFHINREFDSLSSARLTELKD